MKGGLANAECETQTVQLPSFYVLNATSLAKPNAIQLLSADIQAYNCDLALICETWFTTRHADNELMIDGFSLVRQDRQGQKKGGGVCAYIRNNIDFSVIDLRNKFSSFDDNFELLWIHGRCSKWSFIVCICYHPPTSRYQPSQLIDYIKECVDYLAADFLTDFIAICGDFNSLNTSFLCVDCGLDQLVLEPTHCKNIIDKFFISRTELYKASVFKSTVKTKHKALIITPFTHKNIDNNQLYKCVKRKSVVYDLRPHCIDFLRYRLGTYDWGSVIDMDNLDEMYCAFLQVILNSITECIPSKTVTLKSTDPYYITPYVKRLLIKRNRLRKYGKQEEADSMADKINSVISKLQQNRLASLSEANSSELWRAVHTVSGKGSLTSNSSSSTRNTILSDIQVVNEFYAKISTKDDYNLQDILNMRITNNNGSSNSSDNNYNNNIHHLPLDLELTDYNVERLLSKIKNTSPGYDGIPGWVFRTCSYELAGIVCHIIQRTFELGEVPMNWKIAIVTPVPKTNKPTSLSEYRPISVTPILSRLTEKLLVKRWIRPLLYDEQFQDQFAYKPTGSTNGALIKIVDFIAGALDRPENTFVHTVLVDFSRAFDTVNHSILIPKIAKLPIPSNILNWIISFLTGRSQMAKINGKLSARADINRGVVQGSALGPFLFLLMIQDLKTLSPTSYIVKYADDVTLMVPETAEVSVVEEKKNIAEWASSNDLTINHTKNTDINISIKHSHKDSKQITCSKLLGVTIDCYFNFHQHVTHLLSVCNQRFYLLKKLRDQGMPMQCLHNVYLSLIVNRITYCISVWGGFVNAGDRGKIDAVFKKAKRWGFTNTVFDFHGLLQHYDCCLLKKITDDRHSLHHILPPSRNNNLRPKGHNYTLPKCRTNLYKNSFIPRILFSNSS